MSHFTLRTPLAPAATALRAVALAATSLAAATTAQSRPDPLDAKAVVPAASYESSFSQYRHLGDEKAVSWRDANDTVARIGGWRVYAREAQQPDAAPAAAAGASAPQPQPGAVPATQPSPAGHAGHKTP